MDRKDLTGRKMGRLTVIQDTNERRNKGVVWICRCECGNVVKRTTGELNAGRRLSCGCIRTGAMGAWKNGKRERLYIVWCDIIQRCFDKNDPGYQRYGARGITICDEWRHNYPAFREWAFANGYNEQLTIDRIDNDGDYSPDNCRWTTAKVQSRNKSTNVLITYQGETHCISEWSEILGFKYSTLRERLRRGWSVEKAITTPLKKK